jgi:hypothetical protein
MEAYPLADGPARDLGIVAVAIHLVEGIAIVLAPGLGLLGARSTIREGAVVALPGGVLTIMTINVIAVGVCWMM